MTFVKYVYQTGLDSDTFNGIRFRNQVIKRVLYNIIAQTCTGIR